MPPLRGWESVLNGPKTPNDRRVGLMMAQGSAANQFGGTDASKGSCKLLAVDLIDHQFGSVVLQVEDPE